jgi:hypothetical protein
MTDRMTKEKRTRRKTKTDERMNDGITLPDRPPNASLISRLGKKDPAILLHQKSRIGLDLGLLLGQDSGDTLDRASQRITEHS